MTKKLRNASCLCLSALMVSTFVAGNVLAFADDKTGASGAANTYDNVAFEDVTGKINLQSVALGNMNSSVMESDGSASSDMASGKHTFIVELDADSILEAAPAGMPVTEYVATSSGARALKSIESSQRSFLSELTSKGIGYKYVNGYNTVTNAVAITTDASNITKIKTINGVKSVVYSSTYAYPQTVESEQSGTTINPSNVYATGIYNSSKYVEQGIDGRGMVVAVLDTGLDYTHPAFSHDPANPSLSKENVRDLLDSKDFSAEATNVTVNDVYVSAKVPFAYDYADHDADVYPSYSQHGTHVAGIIGGKDDSYTNKDGVTAKDEDGNILTFRGVAPESQLVICKVFTDNFESNDLGGAITEDILAALEDCVKLNVDIINMSLGTSAGFSSIEIDGDTEGQWMNEVYGKVRESGINLVAAASNEYSSGYGGAYGTNLASNPDSGTAGSPSTFTGALSVASINGQLARYMTVNVDGVAKPIYYDDSSNVNMKLYDFNEQMLKGEQTKTYKYVLISGYGENGDYIAVANEFKGDEPVIAVVQRGSNTFQDKVGVAMRNGAAAIIVYNNVAGTIRMNLGDMDDPIPSVSVSLDAGDLLRKATNGGRTGYITINDSFQEGPFMNEYSSWGSTPDLKLKPDITAHGGEITSTVAGGYNEQSGTSMASPNMAGFAALLTSYIKNNPDLDCTPDKYTEFTNQIIMSTATTVYDREGLPYSPRKQGAGLATLDNVFTTSAYLYTDKDEDKRPKIELGADMLEKGKNKGSGVYNMTFKVKNFGADSLTFRTQATFFTEQLTTNGVAVAEKAHLFSDKGTWKVNGNALAQDETFTVEKGQTAEISVTLTLTKAEKDYIETSFKNGMFVEGFLKLIAETDGQCDLTCPFMGFYGDWSMAPMLDMDCYEKAEYDKDTSYDNVTRPQPQVWATQGYASYYNDRYIIPLGSYVYTQDENDQKMYFDGDHAAISRYNEFTDEESLGNYMTTTGLKALYAGLLRNAELVTYRVTNADTGEVVYDADGNEYREIYRIRKAVSGGGSAVPANVKLEWTADDLGLKANGKYALDFHFYRTLEDKEAEDKMTEEEKAVYAKGNTFEMTFYVDYEAPVLVESRIKYRTSGTGANAVQTATLELDVFDNHYPQAVMLCYASSDSVATGENVVIQLATDYITPVYNAKKNDISTVTIDVTEIIKSDEFKNSLYVQIMDYALNYTVYTLSFTSSNQANLPTNFEIAENSKITLDNRGEKQLTLGLNEAFTVKLTGMGDADLSNFGWQTGNPNVAQVKNGQIFATGIGETTITIVGKNEARKHLNVKVVEAQNNVRLNSISFGVIKNSTKALQAAKGVVKVNAGQNFTLTVNCNPWYYPTANLKIKWTSDNENVATVDQYGNVCTLDEKGSAFIKAVVLNENGTESSISTNVTLRVLDPFTITNSTLTEYNGTGGDIVLPDNENITTIGEEAFKDNKNITSIVIPETVTQINERAFKNCTALEAVYFISKEKQEIANSDLSSILHNAFEGCTSLKLVDLSNVKTITVDKFAFKDCTALEEVRAMHNIGTMNIGAFANCTSLVQADISGLHNSGSGTIPFNEYTCDVDENGYVTAFHPEKSGVFYGCTSLKTITTGKYTSISDYMFYGCTALENNVEINCARVGNYAFTNCTNIKTVTFGESGSNLEFYIGAYAFNGCNKITGVTFNGDKVISIGDRAFENCSALTSFALPNSDVILGDGVFKNTSVSITGAQTQDGALYSGTTLLLAPKTINASWSIKDGTTEIAPYAFSDSTLASGVTTVTIPASITKIGEGAFAYLNLKTLNLPDLDEISDYMLYGAENLTQITIPASVKSIGASAFEGCGALATVEFAENSLLEVISDSAFKNCYALVSIVLPEGPEVTVVNGGFTGGAMMGSEVFYGCHNLQTVQLPSLTYLGSYTFFGCTSLTTVTFGENSSVTGSYTFFPGEDAIGTYHSSLTSVTLGDNTVAIGVGAFEACNSLTQIDLKNAVVAAASAFSLCENLATVTGMENLQYIGDEAFLGCFSLSSLNLASATYIGDLAFCVILSDGTTSSARYTSVSMPKVESIGYLAFYGGGVSNVSLPASLESVGAGAFASSRLNRLTIAQNDKFFVENNVLYRYMTPTTYELVLYPSTLTAESYTYTVKEGTVAIGDYAFSGMIKNQGQAPVTKVVLPYSLKTVGINAFANSGVTEYEFHSIAAPVLMYEYNDLSTLYPVSFTAQRVNTMFYYNFENRFIEYSGLVNSDLTQSPARLSISYPTNGTGYDNFIYQTYFKVKVAGNEELETVTNDLKNAIEALASPETVRGWASLAVNEENKKMVSDFADEVIKAHELLNQVNKNIKDGIYSANQLELLGEETLAKLTAVESELRPVKTRFGIKVYATSLRLAENSTHKTSYLSGEKFDMKGLALIVVYNDSSEEIADMSKIKVSSGYDGELSTLDRYVQIEGYGLTLRVNVTVSENENPGNPEDGGNCSGCGTIGSSGSFDGGLLILVGGLGIMFAAMAVAKLKKRN